MKIQQDKIYIPSEKIISRIIENTLVIIPVEAADGSVDFDESLYSLEDVGKDIWQRLDRKKPVKALCRDLADTYDAPLETITADVTALLEDLLEKRLIVEYH